MKIDIFRSLLRWHLRGKVANNADINIVNIENILIISNTAIGDTLFSTPAIRMLKEKYPQKKIFAIFNPKNFQLFENNPFIDKVMLYSGKWRHFLPTVYKLKAHNIDLALIMHSNEPQATPLAYYAGIKYIIKIPNDQNEFRFLHHNSVTKSFENEHFIDRRLKHLEYINIYEKKYHMDIFIKDSWKAKIRDLLDYDRINIGFQIGASSISRMWFLDRWIELARLVLNHNNNWNIVLTGSKADQGLANQLSKVISDDRIINQVGELDLGPAAALIGQLDLLVTPDTGPLHIAAALNTPTIAISVAGKAQESNPISEDVKHIFIQKQITCDPCVDKKCKFQKCMFQISSDEVFLKICSLL